MFDKFHIVRHLMAAVDQVRRDEIREKGAAHKQLVVRSRYMWLNKRALFEPLVLVGDPLQAATPSSG